MRRADCNDPAGSAAAAAAAPVAEVEDEVCEMLPPPAVTVKGVVSGIEPSVASVSTEGDEQCSDSGPSPCWCEVVLVASAASVSAWWGKWRSHNAALSASASSSCLEAVSCFSRCDMLETAGRVISQRARLAT